MTPWMCQNNLKEIRKRQGRQVTCHLALEFLGNQPCTAHSQATKKTVWNDNVRSWDAWLLGPILGSDCCHGLRSRDVNFSGGETFPSRKKNIFNLLESQASRLFLSTWAFPGNLKLVATCRRGTATEGVAAGPHRKEIWILQRSWNFRGILSLCKKKQRS